MAPAMAAFDELTAGACGDALREWVTSGAALGDEPIRCPVGDEDPAARPRLDLALRMLHGQPSAQWCRPAGGDTAVVRRWPLPARGVALLPAVGDAVTFVLAVGRPGGGADLWRFRFDDPPCAVLDRGRELLPT